MKRNLLIFIISILIISPFLITSINKVFAANPDPDTCNIVIDENSENKITFKANDLDIWGGRDEDKRGVELRFSDNSMSQGRSIINTCKTNTELKEGIELENPDSGENNWPGGWYRLEITRGCVPGFDTVDGEFICQTPELIRIRDDGTVRNMEPNEYDHSLTQLACQFIPVGNKPNFLCHTAIGSINTNPDGFIRGILRLITGLAGGLLLILIMLNGYKLMTSQGDPEKIKDAREGIIAAITGILLIIFSISILQLITVNILGLPGFS